MNIINLTKNIKLTQYAQLAISYKDKLFGKINRNSNISLIFKTRFGVHTFLMDKPLDIVVLDKNNKVVKIKKNLKPNSFFFWNPKYNKVIEFPQNTLSKTNISLFDTLNFDPDSINC